jgi:tRNA(Ile)-lysidine synthase
LAVSGGLDSMVLAQIFKQLEIKFTIAHCNYKLRGKDSEEDYLFVKNYCKINTIPLVHKEFETKKIAKTEKKSIQEVARDLRYNWFYEIVETNNIDYLVTAHHLNDSIETILFNLIRGTGIKGLTGIPSTNRKILRPLIEISKSEILDFAKNNKLKFREDKSNFENEYSRNYIRNEILNSLIRKFPNAIQGISKTSQSLVGLNQLLERNLTNWRQTYFTNEAEDFIKFKISEFINSEKFHHYFIFDLLSEFEVNSAVAQEILEAVLKNKKGLVWKNEKYDFTLNREFLLISKKRNSTHLSVFFTKSVLMPHSESKILVTKIPVKVHDFKKLGITKIIVDKNKLSFPLELRTWKNGDIFYPFGMKGKKKLSDFFIDRKLSKFEKENVLIVSSNKEIVWIVGMAADRRFSVEPNTINIVSLNVI